ncbi:unnamed protein product [Caenorhabditis angaria]|uniref:Uncharacterized protein n=1 Tax=Caenorhabditis angaria TaxID=860376 RepID=A0A9P1J4U3_9PELO|nr:unnamed protein product [Caenorhabditis angaria]
MNSDNSKLPIQPLKLYQICNLRMIEQMIEKINQRPKQTDFQYWMFGYFLHWMSKKANTQESYQYVCKLFKKLYIYKQKVWNNYPRLENGKFKALHLEKFFNDDEEEIVYLYDAHINEEQIAQLISSKRMTDFTLEDIIKLGNLINEYDVVGMSCLEPPYPYMPGFKIVIENFPGEVCLQKMTTDYQFLNAASLILEEKLHDKYSTMLHSDGGICSGQNRLHMIFRTPNDQAVFNQFLSEFFSGLDQVHCAPDLWHYYTWRNPCVKETLYYTQMNLDVHFKLR